MACLAGLLVLTAVFSTAVHAQGEAKNVSILYTGDLHGHLTSFYYDSKKPVGGIAKRAIYFQEKRRHTTMSWLTLDTGDAISGTPLSNAFEGYLDIQSMNRLKYDAMCLGVHEFDYGVDVLRQRMSEAEFPILSANIIETATGQPFAKPYEIIDRDGFKIAIIGLTTADIVNQLPQAKFAGLEVRDPFLVARELVPQLAAQNDLVVALTHLGIDEDIKLSSKLQDIDVIVGGLSHAELQVPMKVGRTLIVHDSEFGRHVGLLKLSYQQTGSGWENKYFDSLLEPMSGKWLENSHYLEWLAGYEAQLGQRMARLVGTSNQRLSNLKVFSSETELGNYICDVVKNNSDAHAAILPAAFFRSEIPSGDVTIGDIYTALPYDHYGVVLTVSGNELHRILSDSAANIGKPGFPQVSGVNFGIANGQAYDVQVNGQDVQPNGTYRLATSDYLAMGNLGYATMGTISRSENTGYLIRDMVLDSLRKGDEAGSRLSARINFIVRDDAPIYASNQSQGNQNPASGNSYPPAQQQPVSNPSNTGNPPPGNTDVPPVSGSNDQPPVLYDANGNPVINRGGVEDEAVEIIEEVISDEGSEALDNLRENIPDGREGSIIEDVVPDINTDEVLNNVIPTVGDNSDVDILSSGSLPTKIASETVNRGNLQYTFTMLPGNTKQDYIFRLDIINTGLQRVQLDYATSEYFDFIVMDDQNLVWNYNFNRFFVQSEVSQTLAPGERLNFVADWKRETNSKQQVAAGVYSFVAAHKVVNSPENVSFTLNLN